MPFPLICRPFRWGALGVISPHCRGVRASGPAVGDVFRVDTEIADGQAFTATTGEDE